MDSARFAALFAVMLGAFAMVVNFLALPMLFNKVATIQVQMQVKMDNFKNVADQAWTEMMVLRKIYAGRMHREAAGDEFNYAAVPFPFGYNPPSDGTGQNSITPDPKNITPALGSTVTPITSPVLTTNPDRGQSSIQSSDPSNTCPPGPPGPPGEPGLDGLPGLFGVDGLSGANATEVKLFDEEMCTLCPHGPPGPTGLRGPPGLPGKGGGKGEVGKKGLDGELGKAGFAGFRGQAGFPGKNGTKGVAGKPAPGGRGDKGPKGARGPIGRAGPQGETGKPNFANLGLGLQGLPGKNGDNGTAGKTGPKGITGAVGFVGMEGGFCPCPKELRKLGLGNDTSTGSPKTKDSPDLPPLSDDKAPIANPPSVQAPSTSGQIGAPSQRQPPSSLLDPAINSGIGGLGGANDLPVVGPGQNNLVQTP